MRWLGLGLFLVGGVAALAGGLEAGPHPSAELAIGLILLAAGGIIGLVDLTFIAYLRRIGLRREHVDALQRALRAGTAQGLAAVERLKRDGLAGQARILSLSRRGIFQGRAEVELELEITVEGKPPFRLAQRFLVAQERAEQLQAEQSLPVRVDPDNGERLLIDWTSG